MDAIAAISTAPGIGGIGIVRMSGEECFDILNKIFKPIHKKEINEIKGYTMQYGYIVDPQTNNTIDEVLVSYFKSPKSYTTENMCEINSHGGTIVLKQILELCLLQGANLAEPGEFTKRAFLNGRMDLSQAEAIIDIINSKTEKESKASVHQLEGFLSEKIKKIRNNILDIMVDIEANIDYPEYDVEEVSNNQTMDMLQEVKKNLTTLENTFDDGKIIKEGVKVAIIGKPNAGKSSLLNALLREERAIVTSIEGTTRDTIEEFIALQGVPLKIIDTAGIRQAKDEVEKIGIDKARKIAKQADIIIAIFDINKKTDKEDEEILDLIRDKNSIIVLNKIDMVQEININTSLLKTNKKIVKISALQKEGIDELLDQIAEMFNIKEINVDNDVLVTNIRHKKLITNALKHTNEAIQSLEQNMPIDIIAVNIKEILESLGNITGENVSENIIKEIFSKFCLGK